MFSHRIRFAMLTAVAVGLLLVGLFAINPTGRAESYTINLIAPGFVQTAHAEEGSALAGILDEAGIAGYYQTEGPITIGPSLRAAFRTIEDEKPNYIVGSVPIPSFPESYDVHALVHTDGWIVVYYLKTEPVGKIFDWIVYANGDPSIPTVFETVAPILAGAAGKPYNNLSYYDFRYPNANQMTLIAENNGNEDDFTLQLPSSYSYNEFSWSLYDTHSSYSCSWRLNNTTVGSTGVWGAGTISAGQMLPDTNHTIQISSYGYCEGGLALVYRVP